MDLLGSKLGKADFFLGGCGMSGDEERSGGGTGEGGAGRVGGAGGAGGEGGLWFPVLSQRAWSLVMASSSEQPKRSWIMALVASKAIASHWGGASSAIMSEGGL